MTNNSGVDGKTIGIVSYITLIGWIIAIILNSSTKSSFASFHLRQTLGLWLMLLVLSIIPIINIFAWALVLILWIIGLVSAVNGEEKPVPFVGGYFQEWFKGL